MNDIRTRVKTAALLEALQLVQAEIHAPQFGLADLDQAMHAAMIAAEEAHACAVDDAEEADRYKRHAEMMEVAKEYYTLLEDDKTPPDELSDKLDILLEPFSDDPAFTAFCQMKRAAAGLS
jgi:hypothetical protein